MERIAPLSDVDICYEIDGDDGPPVVMIHGLGFQLTDWDPAFVHRLVAAGYRVIRLDNRDVGRSTHLTGKVALGELRRAIDRDESVSVPYLLRDMADDVAALFDHLAIDAAHVIGVSMGGYVAQELALHHPSRVLSLTSMLSSTGSRAVGQPTADGNRALFRAPAANPDEAVEDMVEARRILATPGAFDEADERARVRRAVARSFDPAGTGRQLAAIWASGDRTEGLRALDVPALVIHGGNDHLVGVSGGRATADAIPDSRLIVIDDMGHDLPPMYWCRILGAIVPFLDSVQSPAAGLRIVPANPLDAPIYARLCKAAFADDVERYGAGPPGLDDPGVHRRLLAMGHCHGVMVGKDIVGGVYMFPDGDDRWNLGSIFLHPDHQHRGIGSMMMSYAETAHPNVRTITLETPYRNDHLHRFYEAHGYERVGTTQPLQHPEGTDPDFHLILYRKAVIVD